MQLKRILFVFFLVRASIVMFYLFLNQMCYLHACVFSCVCLYCNVLYISESNVLPICFYFLCVLLRYCNVLFISESNVLSTCLCFLLVCASTIL